MSKVAFIGLGVMGFPMAGHLARAGHAVTVYNRTAARAAAWLDAHAGQQAESPRVAARGAEFVFTCVGNDDDLREVLFDDQAGAAQDAAAGTVFVDHSTTSATVAREAAAALAGRGLHFVDAPVSGGQAGAEQGILTVMCGGEAAVFARAGAVIEAYARACTLLGPVGSGQLAKMVNQICVAGVVQGLAEGLDFGQRAGLDMVRVLDVIAQGAAQSWQMENRGTTMCEGRYDFGFAVDWMRKDLGIVLDEGARNGATLEVTRLIDRFYAEVQALGGGRWDTSSLIERLRRERG
ncbi:MAG: NAD(P)-dependent oxidoreductase [Gammaproteobacteria bacterium]|nr:NAD(P)-dependent oxidoreductase [Gammaproteobacteria bacterium]